jgi:hypothetical protein
VFGDGARHRGPPLIPIVLVIDSDGARFAFADDGGDLAAVLDSDGALVFAALPNTEPRARFVLFGGLISTR